MTRRRTRPSKRGEEGFTLTELLVAMVVTLIGLAGLMSLHVTTVRGNATASQASEAVLVAEQSLEEMRRISVKTIENTDYPNAFTNANGHELPVVTGRTGVIYKPVLFAAELLAGGNPTNLIRFRVVVYWMDDGAVLPALADLAAQADHALEVFMVRTRVEVL